MFGGAISESFLGGLGADFISGGLGDDTIEGEDGNDLLAGGSTLAPDAYEFVSRSFGESTNDTSQFAAELPGFLIDGSKVEDLTFQSGDTTDRYTLRPRANRSFARQETTVIDRSMISVNELLAGGAPSGNTLEFSLFSAEELGTGGETILSPVDSIPGSASAVLLRVDNAVEQESGEESTTRRYEIAFRSPVGETVDVDVAEVTSGDGGFNQPASAVGVLVDGQSLGGQGVVLSVGNVDGDAAGTTDHILTIRDGVDAAGQPISYARLVFGGEAFDPNADTFDAESGIVLVLPGSLLDPGSDVFTTVSGGGDVNGDGRSDLALFSPRGSRLQVVFGNEIAFGSEDVVSILHYDGDGMSDVLFSRGIPFSTGVTEIYLGADLAESPRRVDLNQPFLLPVPAGTIQQDNARFITTPIGDFNVDGLDAIAMASPNRFARSGGVDVGWVAILLRGTDNGSVEQADAFMHIAALGTALGGRLEVAAGDLDNDGRADLVIGQPLPTTVDLETGNSTPQSTRGDAWIVWDVLSRGEVVRTEDANRTLQVVQLNPNTRRRRLPLKQLLSARVAVGLDTGQEIPPPVGPQSFATVFAARGARKFAARVPAR